MLDAFGLASLTALVLTCHDRPRARSSRTEDSLTMPAQPSWTKPAVTISVSRKRFEPTRPSSRSPARMSFAACSISRRPRPTASLL
jgi:hypothetical protein